MRLLGIGLAALLSLGLAEEERPRARDLGLHPGVYPPGPLNAITDVQGVRVGHATVVAGDAVRTGVTAIVPHSGNLFRDKVAGAVHVFNAFGKLVGATQVQELGQIETPILLTNTLSVWDAAAALADWMLARPGNEEVRSINPVVGETNDGALNDIRGRHVAAEHVRAALAARAVHGMARTGGSGSHGSGDYVIAFSTTQRPLSAASPRPPAEDSLSPLFQAVIEASEEAILNSLLRAATVRGRDGHQAEAIPIDRLREILRRHRVKAEEGGSVHFVGPLVERRPRLAARLDRWARDPDFWPRRSALLALLLPLRRGPRATSYTALLTTASATESVGVVAGDEIVVEIVDIGECCARL